MTKVKLSALLSSATGKIGGVYFTGTPLGFSVRNIGRKRKALLTAATSNVLTFTLKVAEWQKLTPSEKLAYSGLAPVGLSGYNYFMSLPLIPYNEVDMLYLRTSLSLADIAAGTVKTIMPAAGPGFRNVPVQIMFTWSLGAVPFDDAFVEYELADDLGNVFATESLLPYNTINSVVISPVFNNSFASIINFINGVTNYALRFGAIGYVSGGSGSGWVDCFYVTVPE